MYERLLDKSEEPTNEQIKEYLGHQSYERLARMEEYLQNQYSLIKEIRFPFGNDYGWGYKFSHQASHLCYVFFEEGAFTVTIQMGDRLVPSVEQILSSCLPKTVELWAHRYPCGERGGWLHYRILADCELDDIYKFIIIKKKPKRRT